MVLEGVQNTLDMWQLNSDFASGVKESAGCGAIVNWTNLMYLIYARLPWWKIRTIAGLLWLNGQMRDTELLQLGWKCVEGGGSMII